MQVGLDGLSVGAPVRQLLLGAPIRQYYTSMENGNCEPELFMSSSPSRPHIEALVILHSFVCKSRSFQPFTPISDSHTKKARI